MSTPTYPPYQPPTGNTATQKGNPGQFSPMQLTYEHQAKQFVANVLVPLYPSPTYVCGYAPYTGENDDVSVTTDPGATPAALYMWYVTKTDTGEAINGFVGLELQQAFKEGVCHPVTCSRVIRSQEFFQDNLTWVFPSPSVKAPEPVAPPSVTPNHAQLALMAS